MFNGRPAPSVLPPFLWAALRWDSSKLPETCSLICSQCYWLRRGRPPTALEAGGPAAPPLCQVSSPAASAMVEQPLPLGLLRPPLPGVKSSCLLPCCVTWAWLDLQEPVGHL